MLGLGMIGVLWAVHIGVDAWILSGFGDSNFLK